MKILTKNIPVVFAIFSLLFSSCATIVGGSTYYAHVNVVGHPNAAIINRNATLGKGSVTFQVKRKDANKFSLKVKEEGCEEQTFNYRSRTFRGWALVGSLATFTYFYILPGGFIPIPYGVFIDIANGSYWKPSLFEKGVSRMDYKHYGYNLEYTGCKVKEDKQVIIQQVKPTLLEQAKSKAEKLREMKKLLDEGILTQDEFNKEKAKILEEK